MNHSEEKLKLMSHWYQWFLEKSTSWEGKLGSEVAYLLGAIMNDNFIVVDSKSELLKLFRLNKIQSSDRIWSYVRFLDN